MSMERQHNENPGFVILDDFPNRKIPAVGKASYGRDFLLFV